MNKEVSHNHEESGQAIVNKLRMPYLTKHFNARYIWAIFVFVNCLITIAGLSFLAYLSGGLFIFPSLGPTAILFFVTPQAEASRPRNALIGHGIGIICGYFALLVTGLVSAPSVISGGVTIPRVIAASLALALTGAIMVIIRTPHPPAGATTLIVALGFIVKPSALAILELAVLLLVLQALLINWAADIKRPDVISPN